MYDDFSSGPFVYTEYEQLLSDKKYQFIVIPFARFSSTHSLYLLALYFLWKISPSTFFKYGSFITFICGHLFILLPAASFPLSPPLPPLLPSSISPDCIVDLFFPFIQDSVSVPFSSNPFLIVLSYILSSLSSSTNCCFPFLYFYLSLSLSLSLSLFFSFIHLNSF